jgi:diguanylate cyclase
VTEGTLMRDPEASRGRLSALRALGISISIDDFGTGQSSLAQLRSLPVNQLKIDRSFVNEVLDQPELVKYIIDLARALRLTVVAEGVEQEAQARLLNELGADLLQGYWIARPMQQDVFIEWLRGHGVG